MWHHNIIMIITIIGSLFIECWMKFAFIVPLTRTLITITEPSFCTKFTNKKKQIGENLDFV